jgi:transcriptional regulator with XRE-family HTH domain
MSKISNIKWSSYSDQSLAEILGEFVKHHRLEQNKTQAELAEEAGINRSTLIELEKGKPATIMTLIRLLRVLNLLHMLEPFQIVPQVSPIQLAELEQSKRKRASKTKKTTGKSKSEW